MVANEFYVLDDDCHLSPLNFDRAIEQSTARKTDGDRRGFNRLPFYHCLHPETSRTARDPSHIPLSHASVVCASPLK